MHVLCAGTGRIPGNSTPGATPPGSPQAHSQSAFSTFSPLHIQHNARWQLHVERVTERGLALISLIFRKLEALTQMVLSENNGKRFGLQLDRNHEFWGEVVRDILGEITLPRYLYILPSHHWPSWIEISPILQRFSAE